MAAPEALSQVDLEPYAVLAQRLLDCPVSLAMVGSSAPLALAGASEPEWRRLLQGLDAQAADWRDRAENSEEQVADTRLAIVPIRSRGGSTQGHLLVGAALDGGSDSMVRALQPLLDCLLREARLAGELDAMADELTSRYEELNLVYATQDQASDFEETHSQLTDLVENCRSYLSVTFVALILRDQRVNLYSAGPDLARDAAEDALRQLRGQFYDWIVASREVVVINDPDDSLAAVLCPGLPFRLVAVPVQNSNHEVLGVLLIARDYADPSFANSDKNLLDVMARKASKIIQASYDTLTGLVKRSGFEYEVNRALQSRKVGGIPSAVFVIDVDRMQVVNDTLSYQAGDALIRAIAERLAAGLRGTDTVARLGGDEFGAVLFNCDLDSAIGIAEKICGSVAELKVDWYDHVIDAQVSIGIAPVAVDAPDSTSIVAAAEVACSAVKDRGGNAVSVYETGDVELTRRRSQMSLVGRIQETLRADRFELYCQPIVPLRPDDHTLHVEVLVRMIDEQGELLPPAAFLHAAERYHLMPAIDRWVVSKAIAMMASARSCDGANPPLVSINLSGQTLADETFTEFVEALLERSAVAPSRLCFEVTETAAIMDVDKALTLMEVLKSRGVLFSLDDFGTGLSSFSYLKQLPVDFLKIDGSFVRLICADTVAETMVSAIARVAHSMGLKTVGEFVENDDIRRRLCEIGVDYGQGYAIARPGPFQEYLDALQAAPRARRSG